MDNTFSNATHSIASTQSTPLLVLVALVVLYFTHTASAAVTLTGPPAAITTIPLIIRCPGSGSASSPAPPLLLLVLPVFLFLLHEVVALRLGQDRDGTAGHVTVTDHNEI